MCRAIHEGGRRCYFHQFTTRINRLEATLEKKEEALSVLYRTKVKDKEVKARIRELELVIAHKRGVITVLETRLEQAKDKDKLPVERELVVTREQLTAAENEREDLLVLPDAKVITRRIKVLTDLIDTKREQLDVLEKEAAEARANHKPEEEGITAEELSTRVDRAFLNEDAPLPTALHLQLTPEERERLDAERGDQSITDYVLSRSLTSTPTFTGVSSAALAVTKKKTRHDKSAARLSPLTTGKDREVAGRRPAVDARLRSEEVVVNTNLGGRAVLAYYTNRVANSYGLNLADYSRRQVLGIDLYANEGHTSARFNEARHSAFIAEELEAGVLTRNEKGDYTSDPARVVEFRTERHNKITKDAYDATVAKFGKETAEKMFGGFALAA